MKEKFVLDSYALLAFFQGGAGGRQVKEILKRARAKRASVHVSVVNMGEIFYIIARRYGFEKAREIMDDIESLPIAVEEAGLERVLKATAIKEKSSVAYANAFAAALAEELKAVLVTGDTEFKKLGSIDILWLYPQN